MIASNSAECVQAIIGQQITGVLFSGVGEHRNDKDRITLIFADGTGFTFGTGSAGFMVYWLASTRDIRCAVEEKMRGHRTAEGYRAYGCV